MHIKFQVNRIINVEIWYNDFKNMISRKTRLKFDNMFKNIKHVIKY